MEQAGGRGPGHWVLRLDQAGAFVAGIGVLVMMTVGAFDVVLTHFFNRPIPGAFEITEAMMVGSIFLAVAMAQRERKHIRVEFLVDRLPPRGRACFDLLAHLLSGFVFTLIAWYGWRAGIKSFNLGEFSSGLLKFPVWPARLALAVGSSLMVVQCLIDIGSELRKAAGWTRP